MDAKLRLRFDLLMKEKIEKKRTIVFSNHDNIEFNLSTQLDSAGST